MLKLESEKDAPSTDGDVPVELTPQERKRLLRKLDWHLLPFLSLLYLLSFLDRSNIGNAKVAGMAKDLDLVGYRYNIVSAVFFLPYSMAEVPSNIALKLFRPSRWFPVIMLAWGTVMTLMCLVNSYPALIVCRIFLGLTEAGLFPGVTYYISLWYPRAEQASRVAFFYSAATIAGAFGGLLAYGIERMEGIGGLHGWQWIFCLEGLATLAVASTSFFFLHDYPETASFLTDDERHAVVGMLRKDSRSLATHYDTKFVFQAMKDYKTYMQIALSLGILVPIYCMALFMPTIIHALGYSAANAQLLSAPPFIAGCIVTIVIGTMSDKHQLRGPYVVGGCLVSLVGFTVLYVENQPGPSYAGATLAAIGVFPTVAVIIAWASGGAGGDTKRGVALALVTGISNLGGICSSFVYIDPPRFHIGHGAMMGFLSLAIIMASLIMWNYNRLNKQKEALCLEENITEDRAEEFRDMGDDSPLFRYII